MFEDDAYWSGKNEISSVKTSSQNSTENVNVPVVQQTIASDSKNIDYATIKSHVNVHSLIKSYQQRGWFFFFLLKLFFTKVGGPSDLFFN